jgi:hypothetical protein
MMRLPNEPLRITFPFPSTAYQDGNEDIQCICSIESFRAVDYSIDENYGMLMLMQLANPVPQNPSFCGNAVCFSILKKKKKKQKLLTFLYLPPPFYLVYLSFCLLLSQAYLPFTFFSLDPYPSKPPLPQHLSLSAQQRKQKKNKKKERRK